jgi:hypothetical protein
MANLYIREYVEAAVSRNGVNLPVGQEPALLDQAPVAIGGSAEQSEPFSSSTNFIRVSVDSDCFIVIATPVGVHRPYQSPLATNQNAPMWAKSVEYFGVRPGDILSVIENSV